MVGLHHSRNTSTVGITGVAIESKLMVYLEGGRREGGKNLYFSPCFLLPPFSLLNWRSAHKHGLVIELSEMEDEYWYHLAQF